MRTLLISHTSHFLHVYDMLWLFCEAKWNKASNPAVGSVKHPPHPPSRTFVITSWELPTRSYSCCTAGIRLSFNSHTNCNNCKILYYFPNIIYGEVVCNLVALYQPAAGQLGQEFKWILTHIKRRRGQVCLAPLGTVKKASKKVKISMCKTKK